MICHLSRIIYYSIQHGRKSKRKTSTLMVNEINGSRKIPPGKTPLENILGEKFPREKLPPWKISPGKIPTHKFPIWNILTHFINCLSSLNTASINGGRVYMYILPVRKILISPGRLRVFSWNFGNSNKIFIKNIFSALSIKYLRMIKLQFLGTTHNLLTRFPWKKLVTSF